MSRALTFLSLSILASTVFAQDETKKGEPKAAPLAIATKGTPKVDGKIDDAWKAATAVEVKKAVADLQVIEETKMATGKVKLMWDASHIYALWEVADKNLSADASDAWEQDSVELFLDENNKKSPYYQSDDAQYRCNFKGELTGQGEGFKQESLKAAARKTKTGYVVEMAIKLNNPEVLKADALLGMELQINDDPGTGARGAVAKWNHTGDESWEDTTNFGTLKLK